MTSLSLLEVYSSSENENENESGDGTESAHQPKEKLPTPSLPSFKVCKSITRNPVKDESLHKGRIRSFPHNPGDWATYVFIPIVESSELSEFIEDLSEFFMPFKLEVSETFHVSLTKTVILKHHWIRSFVETIQDSLSTVQSFNVGFGGLKVYLNENKTRTFLGVEVCHGSEDLKLLVNCLDKCLVQYNLETFYENPSFHFSILWCVGDKLNEFENILKNLPSELSGFTLVCEVIQCFCTSGNKNFSFNFTKR